MCTSEEMMDVCKEFIGDSQYVYKICNREYIIVLKKLPETITNELRTKVINADHAKFRASVLEVVLIVSIKDTNDRPQQVLNTFVYYLTDEKYDTLYTVGETVVPHVFDTNINSVCTGGIHYFKTLETAFTYERSFPVNFTGYWTNWYENGQIFTENNYINGEESGHYVKYYKHGHKRAEGSHVAGRRHGKWIEWHRNDKIQFEGEYINGYVSGKWIKWDRNGQIEFEAEYIG